MTSTRALALGLVLVVGCGGGTTPDDAGNTTDGGSDGGSPIVDGGHDAAPTDAGSDAGHDVGTSTHDAGHEPLDVGTDAASHPDGGTSVLGDCTSDANCPGGHCVALVPGGFHVCQFAPVPVTSCDPGGPTHGPDECCNTTDCSADGGAGGTCYLNPPLDCHSLHRLPQNECMTDECQNDNDCIDASGDPPDPDLACVAAGTIGSVRTCITAYCHTDADCTAEAGGHCVLTGNTCCHEMNTLACAYASDGCRADVDCASNHCVIDSSSGRVACAANQICF